MDKIIITGAREHNLRSIDLELPRDQLIVFTGVSGSGKSSLAFDTLYAEGQRRYIESLSSYARQFLGQMEKPRVDQIVGLSPTISIQQKATNRNPRSTVGTITEIHDFLRVLFARIGRPHCPKCGRPIGSQTAEQIVEEIMKLPAGTRFMVNAPVVRNRKGEFKNLLESLRQQGFIRAIIDGELTEISTLQNLDKKRHHDIDVVVDRLIASERIRPRLTDSVETALRLAEGLLAIQLVRREGNGDLSGAVAAAVARLADSEREDGAAESEGGPQFDDDGVALFSEHNACSVCGVSFPELTPQMFSFNSPQGMCPSCGGLGSTLEVDPELVVPDPELSIRDGAVAVWGKIDDRKSWRLARLESLARHYDFSLDTPWEELSEEARDVVLNGSGDEEIEFTWEYKHGSGSSTHTYAGVIDNLKRLHRETKSDSARNFYSRFFTSQPCRNCGGKKLRPEALAVTIDGYSIHELGELSTAELLRFFDRLELDDTEHKIADELLKEVRARLEFLVNVGLYYLTLNRSAPTLSGGESQRIRLASQIGCGLVGVLYILDEPSIGLHHRDNAKLIRTLTDLRDLGNTVLVVEHDEDTMRAADQLVDFGPGAGHLGGRVVAQGTPQAVMDNSRSLTGRYLKGELSIPIPKRRRRGNGNYLELSGATFHNLKHVDLRIPLGTFTCVTGVSGSGKSSLINETLYPALASALRRSRMHAGPYEKLSGVQHVDKVIDIDQSPIGRTPRSNPATYIKVFDHIRRLFAQLPAAKVRGYSPGRFSFNVRGGRCENCQGEGIIKIEMHFLPDVYVTCDVCNGRRYNKETLSVRYRGHNISDVLEMDVSEALELFANVPQISRMLETLSNVGLDYVKLGQPATTLSGGEAQRVKLARELTKRSTGKTVYILDEPTTGLHFADIAKLLSVLQTFVDNGNTVVVIEHNLEVIKNADYIVDLGPEGGEDGGRIIAQGTPERVAESESSYTGLALRTVFEPRNQRELTTKK
jgi:excinuclease ABC subunit A